VGRKKEGSQAFKNEDKTYFLAMKILKEKKIITSRNAIQEILKDIL
jgi:hypothetical protein